MNPSVSVWSRISVLSLLLIASGTSMLSAQAVGLSSFEGLNVTTAERTDAARFTDAGIVSVVRAGGFVVTIAGELKGRADRDGVVGVLLVPDRPFFDSLYRSRKLVLAAAEFTAPVAAGDSSYFVSQSTHAVAGFPAYHLYLFNTTGVPATVNVYINPTNN